MVKDEGGDAQDWNYEVGRLPRQAQGCKKNGRVSALQKHMSEPELNYASFPDDDMLY